MPEPTWTKVADSDCLAVAVFNYSSERQHHLSLRIGDVLHVQCECAGWLFGRVAARAGGAASGGAVGVFPASYTRRKRCVVHTTSNGSGHVFARESPLLHEITCVIREWVQIFKTLYVASDERLSLTRHMLRDVCAVRRRVIAGSIPCDELRAIKLHVASIIDRGNFELGLDLVVRDEQGNVINPDLVSAVQLFRQHKLATTDHADSGSVGGDLDCGVPDRCSSESSASCTTSFCLHMSLENFVWRHENDCELIFFLYNPLTSTALTENYVVMWGRDSISGELDQCNDLHVIFTNLDACEIEGLYLVCYVVRCLKGSGAAGTASSGGGGMLADNGGGGGSMSLRRCSSVSIMSLAAFAGDMSRRAGGVAVVELTSLFAGAGVAGGGGRTSVTDENKQHFLPMLCCGEKDTLDMVLRKLISLKEGSSSREFKNHGYGVFVSLTFLPGDIEQVRFNSAQSTLARSAAVALRRSSHHQVPVPGGESNDLYMTLVGGELWRNTKSHERNVEARVVVCDDSGYMLPEAIVSGAGAVPLSSYTSVVYRNDGRQCWMENIKLKLSVEQYDTAHVCITFRRRSTNDTKDRAEKAFALCYFRLKESSGVALRNNLHELSVYRMDSKRCDECDLSYLTLPSFKDDTALLTGKPAAGQYTLAARDVVLVETILCSDGLTQNVDLLQVLQCRGACTDAIERIALLPNVARDQLVCFLRAILDVLFSVLDSHAHSDTVVFSALLTLLTAVGERKYAQFQSVLDLYLQEDFSSVLIGSKLIDVLQKHVDDRSSPGTNDVIVKTLACLGYIFKFTVRSHQLHCGMHGEPCCADLSERILTLLRSLSALMTLTVANETTTTISVINENCPAAAADTHSASVPHQTSAQLESVQLCCLRHMPDAIDTVLFVCPPTSLSVVLVDMLQAANSANLSWSRLRCVRAVIDSQLFSRPECRQYVLPSIVKIVAHHLEMHRRENISRVATLRQRGRSSAKLARVFGERRPNMLADSQMKRKNQRQQQHNELHLCVDIVSSMMDVLWRLGGASVADMDAILSGLLPKLLQMVICMDRNESLVCCVVACLVSVLRQMSKRHYDTFIASGLSVGEDKSGVEPRPSSSVSDVDTAPDCSNQLFFLMEVLMVFRDLISRCVFPSYWCEMIMLQNSVILKSLRFFSHTIRDRFLNPFEAQLCNNFFHCAIAFLTQASLQLDTFSATKRDWLLLRYKDMRKVAALEIHTMWISLGQHKILFVPSMVGPFLEMTLVADQELRAMTVPLFFDMMQCEFYSPARPGVDYADTKRDACAVKCNFDEFEREMINKLDHLIEGGRGDSDYMSIFEKKMVELCENHSSMREQGLRFVSTVVELMRRLLEYRTIMQDGFLEDKMSCTALLLHFYHDIERRDMYMRYVDKLCGFHLSASNYVEAGYTLKLHTDLLHWSNEPLSSILRHSRHTHLDTHGELKEALYHTIIDYLDKGNMWEVALEFCRELCSQYEHVTFDYDRLSLLLRRMARLYECIVSEHRPVPEYFRVGFYGLNFPGFLQNKVYIYRGGGYERLADFTQRLQNQFPRAELLSTLNPPSDNVTQRHAQFLQINKVDPCMDSALSKFSGKDVSNKIMEFYKVNGVDRFTYSRPMPRTSSGDASNDDKNPFAKLWLERTVLRTSSTLPGVLSWVAVQCVSTYDVSPLENAVETIQATNTQLRELVLMFRADTSLQLNPLTQKLNGVIDAAVMGGISNYEKAFFSSRYLDEHPEEVDMVERLKVLIAKQIPLLEAGLELHGVLAVAGLRPLQNRLEQLFASMKADVQQKFGVQECDLPAFKCPVTVELRPPVDPKLQQHRSSGGSVQNTRRSTDAESLSRWTHTLTRSRSIFHSSSSAADDRGTNSSLQDDCVRLLRVRQGRNKHRRHGSSGSTSHSESTSSQELSQESHLGRGVAVRTSRIDCVSVAEDCNEMQQQNCSNISFNITDVCEDLDGAPPPLPMKQSKQAASQAHVQ